MFSFLAEFKTAQKLASQKFDVIFFAESGYYFQYFQHLFEELVRLPGVKVAYLTADKNDKVLGDERVQSFYLKNTLAGVFPRLQADVMILTMPDLQNFIFKKSATVKKYAYVFHALVSTHQQYRTHAFDHYDAIFCTGPQQEQEIRESEKLYSLTSKEIVRYGYPLLETLKGKVKQTALQDHKILIAPSWYKEGILNTCILPLVTELCSYDYEVWIRPHPEFIKRNKKVYGELMKQMEKNTNIHFDDSSSVFTHLADSAYLITDRSGIALEYAFATGRPVLFIDTPLKIQNPDVAKYGIEPLENRCRKKLGESLAPDELNRVGEVLQRLKTERNRFKADILAAESEIVFSPSGWQEGIEYIKRQLH